jgi:hypothetical protein
MDEALRSFQRPVEMRADLFQLRGGTGGRSLNGRFFFPVLLCLAWYFSLHSRHFLREGKKERAEPSAALMAARRNMAGLSDASVKSGIGRTKSGRMVAIALPRS